MDFWRTVLVLFRRWYITLPAFVGTLVVAAGAFSSVPVQYQSTSVLVLTTPLGGGSEPTHAKYPATITNPLLSFDQSLALAAAVVIQQMNSAETAHTLGVTPGAATSYQVGNGSSNPELLETGPFVFVQGNAPSAQAAQAITTKVSEMTETVLAARQQELDAPPSTRIGIQVVVTPTAGQPLESSPLRAAAAAGALAGLGSLVAVFGFESFMTRRRRRTKPEDQPSAQPSRFAAISGSGELDTAWGSANGDPSRYPVTQGTAGRGSDLSTAMVERPTQGGPAQSTAGAVDVLEPLASNSRERNETRPVGTRRRRGWRHRTLRGAMTEE